MQDYIPVTAAFNVRLLGDRTALGISPSGDHAYFSESELATVLEHPESLPYERQAELIARFFLQRRGDSPGTRRLLNSRRASKRETITEGPSLHLIVPTLQCAHSCQYCQVSRSLGGSGYTMSDEDLERSCTTIFQSSAPTLTVEFQGGDPLIRYDLVKRAIERIAQLNVVEGRTLRFVVTSTLHQLNEEMCAFFREHQVILSTSIDGPEALHNRNRPIPSRDSYQRTVTGISLAREQLGHDCVSALMTTTLASLSFPEAIVDEYVKLGFNEVFLRPLSRYGFAKRNEHRLGYTTKQFHDFYVRALNRVLHWNQQGVELREAYAAIVLNKILSPFDAGYVDLQSPTGAGLSCLVYNYDGFVYPSDEARMLAEAGDASLRLGHIGVPISELLRSSVQQGLIEASLVEQNSSCKKCAYNLFCAPNPVDSQAQSGTLFSIVEETEHCQRHLMLFDHFYSLLRTANDDLLDLFQAWATPRGAMP